MKEVAQNQEKVSDIHRNAIIIDCLFGMSYPPKDASPFEEMREAGLTAAHLCIAWAEDIDLYEVMRRINSWYQGFEKYGDIIMLVTTSKDIETAKKQNKVGLAMGFQTTKPIEGNVEFLSAFHKLGIRVIQLTYQRRNLIGDGCGERTDSGLSKFGIEVIKRMNKLGILIDASHCGYKTTMEAIEISEKPIAFTHANPRALCDIVRNKTDDQIKALAGKGGVISLNAYSPFFAKGAESTLDDFLDIIDYAVDIAGIEHVGLGLDYNFSESKDDFDEWAIKNPEISKGFTFETKHPKGMKNIRFLPELTKGLVSRGYSEEEVNGLLGGNNLRLFTEVWAA